MFTKLHAILEVIGTRSKIVAISDDSTKIDLKLAELQKENPQGEYVRQFDISSDIEEIEREEIVAIDHNLTKLANEQKLIIKWV